MGSLNHPTLDDNGNPTGFCFSNNGDISFMNLNLGKGSMEELGMHLDTDLSKFDCTIPVFDTEDHDEWLTSH